MNVDELAEIHAAAFTTPRPWGRDEFAQLLASPHTFLVTRNDSFALGRVTLDEAELLTLATLPTSRRKGLARTCLQRFDQKASELGAISAFLEVAQTNQAAIALYRSAGWQPTGKRPNYYVNPAGTRIDAQIMGKSLP